MILNNSTTDVQSHAHPVGFGGEKGFKQAAIMSTENAHKLAEKLIQKGLEQAALYSWEQAAQLFWKEILATKAVSS